MSDRIGFIGLGLMGLPMARNLCAAGFELTVHNRTLSKAEPLQALGAEIAKDIPALAGAVQGGVIVICLVDTPVFQEAVQQLCRCELRGTLVIDMGTTAVSATKAAADDLARSGASFIDAPVSGGAVGAEQGSLSIMAGGLEADLKRAGPLFEVMGKSTTHIGPVGAGQVAKAANQAIVGITLSAVAEAMVLAKAAGADPAKLREALLGGFAASRILELHGQRMIDRSFEPGGRTSVQSKDLAQAQELAKEHGLSLPVLAQVDGLWRELVEQGFGKLDQSGYLLFAEALQNADAKRQ